MKRRTRLNRERAKAGVGSGRTASPDITWGVPHMAAMFLTPQERTRLSQMAVLDARQQKAVRDWMTFYGDSFENAYYLVSRENRFPPRRF